MLFRSTKGPKATKPKTSVTQKDNVTSGTKKRPPKSGSTARKTNGSTNNDEVHALDNDDFGSANAKKTPSSTPSSKVGHAKSNGNPPSAVDGSKNKTYIQLVEEAINNMKEYRTGSSLASIKKYIITNYPHLYDISQNNYFNARINTALKTGCQATPIPRFQKVKVSYRIAPEYKSKMNNQKRLLKKSMSTGSKSSKQQQSSQNGNSATADNDLNDDGSPMHQLSEEEQTALDERRWKREEAERVKAAEEARLKQMMERIRRRKFPMEDTKLHTEDKLYHVKPPSHVTTRPYLPYFWYTTIPLNHPNRYGGKTNTMVLNASKVDTMDIHDNRGIVPDLLHIYHFFMGDIHFLSSSDGNSNTNGIIPSSVHFKHLIYSCEQILNGTMKRTKCVPPLIVHLFVTCLQLLLTQEKDGNDLTKEEKLLQIGRASCRERVYGLV